MPAEDSIELEVSEECTMIEEIEKSEIIEEKVNSRRPVTRKLFHKQLLPQYTSSTKVI